MKKFLLLFVFAIMCFTANAQNKNDGTSEYFIEVYLEWGGKNHIPIVFYENNEGEYIYDTNGDKLKFKSRSAVINHFTKLGWEFVYIIANGADERLLLKKQIKNVLEAKEGLIFKNDLKK